MVTVHSCLSCLVIILKYKPVLEERGSGVSAAGKPCRGGTWETDPSSCRDQALRLPGLPINLKARRGQSVQCCCGEI